MLPVKTIMELTLFRLPFVDFVMGVGEVLGLCVGSSVGANVARSASCCKFQRSWPTVQSSLSTFTSPRIATQQNLPLRGEVNSHKNKTQCYSGNWKVHSTVDVVIETPVSTGAGNKRILQGDHFVSILLLLFEKWVEQLGKFGISFPDPIMNEGEKIRF